MPFQPPRARRFAVRTSAAATDAFSVRAERSSGVMFLADARPPCQPKIRAIFVMAARTSGGIFIPSMGYLTGYGGACELRSRTVREGSFESNRLDQIDGSINQEELLLQAGIA